MRSRFREQLIHWTELAVFTQPDQWKGFLSAMVTAHEPDILYMSNFLEEVSTISRAIFAVSLFIAR